ncbi:bacillithiol system redox-active protein YtxJ [Salisediminibacterium beveridgei]|uniref:Bacillithiol system protein YtxJ n=1 Tax=Salisediminibacterium beveridgei TaxID=632773 RepID=A0A1D7QT09_9BACI|nr:bacillithiol system redox-active protein YtxJ [Salisediminibacterium beveridgei]AOM82143.1 hypothetical protein BBEV_0772 [Salisediminibacterium beveridgei]
MRLQKIMDWEDLKAATRQKGKLFVLKNSTTCPVSREAMDEVQKYAESFVGGEPPVVYLNVQEARELSNQIEDAYGVKHQSPQLLLIEDQAVSWNASHWKITQKACQQAFER